MLEVSSVEWTLVTGACQAACDKEAAKGFSSLDDRERTLFCVWVANGAVGNGGFHSLCSNHSGDYLQYFPEAFQRIGASEKGALLKKLSEVFGPTGPSNVWRMRVRQHQRLSRTEVAEIDALNDAYGKSGEEIDELLLAFCQMDRT